MDSWVNCRLVEENGLNEITPNVLKPFHKNCMLVESRNNPSKFLTKSFEKRSSLTLRGVLHTGNMVRNLPKKGFLNLIFRPVWGTPGRTNIWEVGLLLLEWMPFSCFYLRNGILFLFFYWEWVFYFNSFVHLRLGAFLIYLLLNGYCFYYIPDNRRRTAFQQHLMDFM